MSIEPTTEQKRQILDAIKNRNIPLLHDLLLQITTLTLDSTKLTPEDRKVIIEALKQNYTLKSFFCLNAKEEKKINKILEKHQQLSEKFLRAVKENNLNLVQKLLHQGVPPITQDHNENTALHLAIQTGQPDIILYLLFTPIMYTTCLTIKNKNDETPLDVAKHKGYSLPQLLQIHIQKMQKQVLKKEAIIPTSYCCPITKLIMFDPVMTTDGKTYEKEAIIRSFKQQEETSSKTKKICPTLFPNKPLKKDIFNFLFQYPNLWDNSVYFSEKLKENFVSAVMERNLDNICHYLSIDKRLLTIPLIDDKKTLLLLAYEYNFPEIFSFVLERLSKQFWEFYNTEKKKHNFLELLKSVLLTIKLKLWQIIVLKEHYLKNNE